MASTEAPEKTSPRPSGQGRKGGPLRGLLSFLGGVLTLLTAGAVVVLLLGAPALAPGGDADVRPPDARSDRGPGTVVGAWTRLAARLAAPEFGWLRELGALAAPSGIGFADTELHLGPGADGRPLVLSLDRLTLESGEPGGRARFEGRLGAAPAVPVSGTLTLGPEAVRARLRFERTSGLAALLGVTEATVAGGPLLVDLEASADGARVDLVARSAGPMLLGAPVAAGVLPVDSFEAAIGWETSGRTLSLERVSLRSPALALVGSGSVGAEHVDLALALTDVDARWARHLWPRGVAAGARAWVTENIPTGLIERLDLRLDLDAAALAGALDPDDIQGTAQISGAEIHYLRPMPPVTDARATARFDADALVFDIAGGTLEDIDVVGGEVRITGYRTGETEEWLETTIDARGAVATILEVVDHEPLTLATRHDLPKATSRGTGSFRVEVDLPLLKGLGLDDVGLRFSGDFTDVALPGMAAGRDLSGATVRLEATPERVEASGEGLIDQVQLAFGYVLDTTADLESLRASGRIAAGSLGALGLPPGLPIDGFVGIEADVSLEGAVDRTTLTLDLTDAEIEVPLVAIWKPAGIEGRAVARITEGASGMAIEALAVGWPGFSVEASGVIDHHGSFVRLEASPLVLAASELALEVRRDGAVLDVDISGPRLDLSPLHAPPSDRSPAEGEPLPDMRLDWAIDEISSGNAAKLLDATGGAVFEDGALRRLQLDARTPEASRGLEVRIATVVDEVLSVRIESDDAGGALRALDLSDALHGGRMTVDATVVEQRPVLRAEGVLTAEGLAVLGTPAIVRRLAAAPEVSGLGSDAIEIGAFSAPFTLADETLSIRDANLRAAQLAARLWGDVDLRTNELDLEGNLAPLATVNRFIGRLPVIGDLLQGTNEAGAFAVSFTVQGRRDDPAVVVNPLTALTPGILQDLFRGIAPTPPRLPED